MAFKLILFIFLATTLVFEVHGRPSGLDNEQTTRERRSASLRHHPRPGRQVAGYHHGNNYWHRSRQHADSSSPGVNCLKSNANLTYFLYNVSSEQNSNCLRVCPSRHSWRVSAQSRQEAFFCDRVFDGQSQPWAKLMINSRVLESSERSSPSDERRSHHRTCYHTLICRTSGFGEESHSANDTSKLYMSCYRGQHRRFQNSALQRALYLKVRPCSLESLCQGHDSLTYTFHTGMKVVVAERTLEPTGSTTTRTAMNVVVTERVLESTVSTSTSTVSATSTSSITATSTVPPTSANNDFLEMATESATPSLETSTNPPVTKTLQCWDGTWFTIDWERWEKSPVCLQSIACTEDHSKNSFDIQS